MVNLHSEGLAPTTDTEVALHSYVTSVRGSESLSQSAINTLVTDALDPYATTAYVTERDELNASRAQVDAGDETKLKKSLIGADNGVVALDSTGRVSVAQVPGTSTQKWPVGPYAPDQYLSGTEVFQTENTVFSVSVPDPGYPYQVVVSGTVEVRTDSEGTIPTALVSSGASIFAKGKGPSTQFIYGVETFDRTSPSLGAGWEETYTGRGSGKVQQANSYCFWDPSSSDDSSRRGIFRKIGDFSTTVGNYQEVSMKLVAPPEEGGLFGTLPSTRIYGRMSNSRSTYCAFEFDDERVTLVSGKAGTETTLVSADSGDFVAGDIIRARFGDYETTNERRFILSIVRGTSEVILVNWNDTAHTTSMGDDNLGWGFGGRIGMKFPPDLGLPTLEEWLADPLSLDWLNNLPTLSEWLGLVDPEGTIWDPLSLISGPVGPTPISWIALVDPVANWNSRPDNYVPVVLNPLPTDFIEGSVNLSVTVETNNNGTVACTDFLPNLHVMLLPQVV